MVAVSLFQNKHVSCAIRFNFTRTFGHGTYRRHFSLFFLNSFFSYPHDRKTKQLDAPRAGAPSQLCVLVWARLSKSPGCFGAVRDDSCPDHCPVITRWLP